MTKLLLIIMLLIVIVISGQHGNRGDDIVIEDKLMPVLVMRNESKVIDYEEIEKNNIKNLLKSTRELDSLVKVQLNKIK